MDYNLEFDLQRIAQNTNTMQNNYVYKIIKAHSTVQK